MESRTRRAVRALRWIWIAELALISACGGGYGSGSGSSIKTPAPMPTPQPMPAPQPMPTPPPTASAYSMSRLVSDGAVPAATTDAHLINPWGIVFAPNAPVWIANNGTQTATLYDGTGLTQPLVVNIPAGPNGTANPSGIVFNASSDFAITEGSNSAPAKFIFAGAGGTISAWAPTVDAHNALIAYDDGAGGAVYKGLAIAADGSSVTRLYAADFHNGKVDVFDASFHKVATTGGFSDPTLPQGYAPFGIQALSVQGATLIYIAYAKQDDQRHDNVNLNGAGLGLIDVFDTQGTLQTHLVASGGKLNAPWGIALAPAGFGTLSNELLVGNFGDGLINAFDPSTGAFIGTLSDASGQPIANPGLWGIAFGNGAHNQPTTTLYFAAGIASEADGLYGRIDLGATPPDVVAPTAAITQPAANATVSGSVTVTASASDNVGVASVHFFAGATAIGTASTAPYSISWDTTQVADGNVAITAQAQDAAGNIGTSVAVTVTVSNHAAPTAVTLSQLQTQIFTPICAVCHTGGGASLPASMNLTAGNAFASLVNVASVEQPALKRVAPNDPDNSYIVHKLEGSPGISGQRMPAGGPFLDQPTIDQVRAWITQGALNN